MNDPLRSAPAADTAEVPERDREARVEELLVSGLDHYFNGQHELAINVWTRVLFIDRGHARARAYIERARSAVSERQREAEEMVHAGAAAFAQGDVDGARRLVTSAMERGAATEEAFVLLERVDRLEAAGTRGGSATPASRLPTPARRRPDTVVSTTRLRLRWIAAGAVLGMTAAVAAMVWTRADLWLPLGSTAIAIPVESGRVEPLPVPAPSDVWMARARASFEKGRLREAQAALDEIRHGDPLRGQADELRATIQRRLLEAREPKGR